MVQRIFSLRVYTAAKCLMLLFALGLPGCGRTTGTLTGKVTANSDPVAVGELVFEAIGESSQRQFYGQTDPDGMIVIDYHRIVEHFRVVRIFGKEVKDVHTLSERKGGATGCNGLFELGPCGPRCVAAEKECNGSRFGWIVVE